MHGPYASYPYVEMRYVRFADSSLLTALLFRVFEETQSLALPKIANQLRQNASQELPMGRQLITLSLDEKVSEERILLGWNSDERAVRECVQTFSGDFDGFLQRLEGEYKFRFVRLGEESPKLPKNREIVYWDTGDGTTVLLYPAYSLPSFTVTPCGHIHLKSHLFGRVRAAMKCPMTLEEFETRGFICMSSGICGQDIAEFAFTLGKETSIPAINSDDQQLIDGYLYARFSIVPLRRKEEKQCAICQGTPEKRVCLMSCSVCLSCLTITSLTSLLFSCPSCRTRVRTEFIPRILEERRKTAGVKGLKEVCECRGCGEEKAFSGFQRISSLDHRCWTCDQCLLATDFGKGSSVRCPHCSDNFSQRELTELRQWQQKANPPSSEYHFEQLFPSGSLIKMSILSQSGPKETCRCGEAVRVGRLSCRNKCLCDQCLMKHYLLTGSTNCPNCQLHIEGTFPPYVKCSECLKSFDIRNQESQIYGICEKGCILCRFCIKVQDSHLLCPVCGSSAKGRPFAEVVLAQAKLILACPCEETGGELYTLKCGHTVHSHCKNLIFSCRMCGEFLKAKGEQIKLAKYL